MIYLNFRICAKIKLFIEYNFGKRSSRIVVEEVVHEVVVLVGDVPGHSPLLVIRKLLHDFELCFRSFFGVATVRMLVVELLFGCSGEASWIVFLAGLLVDWQFDFGFRLIVHKSLHN